MELIERKIGETFEFEGKKIEVKAASSDECDGCFFNTKCTLESRKLSGECDRDWRNDRKSVLFVEKQPQKNEEIKSERLRIFNPKTLKPFDKVLARLDSKGIWCCELFSFIEDNTNLIKCCGAYYKHCIPFNEETKHLVGTKDEAPEFYRYWED